MKTKIKVLSARWVIPVVPRNTVLEHHAIVVEEGNIIDILPTVDAEIKYKDAEFDSLKSHVLIPGLINAHTHAAMSLFRGMADDLPLMSWLNEHIWPAEARYVNREFMQQGTELAIAEMLLSGTTCFNDMYFFNDSALPVLAETGIRGFMGMVAIEFPTKYGSGFQEYWEKAEKLYNENQNPLIRFTIAPHAPYSVSEEGACGAIHAVSYSLA